MNAIRQDEAKLTKYHSLHVDQYDWEMVIRKEDRHLDFLKLTVKKLWRVLQKIKTATAKVIPLQDKIAQKVTFISSQELLNLFPNKKPEEREKIFAQSKKVIFVYKIGDYLSNSEKHAERAPDYDDWKLNGDLIVWDTQNNDAMELSSMGIRVDKKSLLEQLQKKNAIHKKNNTFHQQIITNQLPLTIGGGIGKSRINMFILEQDHIKNVQPSYEAFL